MGEKYENEGAGKKLVKKGVGEKKEIASKTEVKWLEIASLLVKL